MKQKVREEIGDEDEDSFEDECSMISDEEDQDVKDLANSVKVAMEKEKAEAEEKNAEPEEELSPLFMFLASSLNVELVYIILRSINTFSKVTRDENNMNVLENTVDINASLTDNDTGCTLNIHRLEIFNANRWSSTV